MELITVGAADRAGLMPAQVGRDVEPADRVYAAVDGGTLAGVVATSSRGEDRELCTWWVDPAWRGRGIGGMLFRCAIASVRPHRLVVGAEGSAPIEAILKGYGFGYCAAEQEWSSPSGMIRQAVRAVVVDDGNRFAMVLFDFNGSKFWNLPGGGIEPDETTRSALVRELDEELGTKIAQDDIGPLCWRRLHWWTDYPHVSFSGQLERVHRVSVHRGELAPSIGWEGLAAEGVIDAGWWSIEQLVASGQPLASDQLIGLLARALESKPKAGSVPIVVDGSPE